MFTAKNILGELGETRRELFAEYRKGCKREVFPLPGGEYFPLRGAEYFAEYLAEYFEV